ncbi:hypothetical protein GBA52_026328 [Prunus armeniaca]|nr:hypothetical protein GBA52_026328 [Prunus armeniaca]
MISKFWWKNSKYCKGISWAKWEHLCFTKDEGGMGFRDLELFNKALVAKQCWRLITNEQSMIHKVLKARYFPNCNFLAAGKGRASSYVWRSLIWGCELLLSGLRKRIGDGQETLVYGDAWIPRPNSFRPISPQVRMRKSRGHQMGISLMILRGALQQFDDVTISFSQKGCNQGAHFLARHALNCNTIVTWIEEVPLWLASIVKYDIVVSS